VTTRTDLIATLERAARGWAAGDARAVADCFAADVDYRDPFLYRFTRREDLLPFFEPPPGGHHVLWHAVLWDDETAAGAVEYTYHGHHRYHGAAIVKLDGDGRIVLWREWQHLDDMLDWDARLAGPPPDESVLGSIDHVQLGMPAGGEDAGRRFYIDLLGLHEVTKPPELAGRGGVWLTGRAVSIHLGVEEPARLGGRSHPAFVVDDLAAVRSRIVSSGIAIEEDAAGLAVARCYVRDPFGNRLELVDSADAGFSSGR
jgi:catechol 2,3-dioxygenase-like lactoylglutathione lyase family enzyme